MVSPIGVVILVILALLFIAWLAAEYILKAAGLYKLASFLQISNPWMSWLPLFQDWIVGKIAEKEDESHGIKRKWGSFLIIFDILTLCSMAVFWVAYVFIFIFIIGMAQQRDLDTMEAVTAVTLIVLLFLVIIVASVMSLIATAGTTCQLICMYKVFEHCVSKGPWKSWLIYLLVPIYGSYRLLRCVNDAIERQQRAGSEQSLCGEQTVEFE